MAVEPVTFEIEAALDDVWRVIGERWDEVHRIVPRISDSFLTNDVGIGKGATRRCVLSNPAAGMDEVEERIIRWDPPRSFIYELLDPPFPLRRLTNTWSLEATDAGTRLALEPELQLRGRPFTKPLEGLVLRWMMADLASDQRAMKGAIEAAVADLE